MKYFILIAYIWNPSTETLDAYVIDHALTGEDCVSAMIELDPIISSHAHLACEFDGAQPDP